MKYYSAVKKNQTNAICSNMDATRDYHTKWSKSETEKQIPYDTTKMWTQMNLSMKEKQNHGHREQTSDCQGGGSLWRDGVGVWG